MNTRQTVMRLDRLSGNRGAPAGARPMWRGFRLLAAAALIGSVTLAGCDDDDDIDHDPPAGQGSIVVDNDGYRDLHVYIDGVYQGEVRDGHRTAYDRAPGVYRVVLDESGSDRGYSADVDVLAGRLTVLEATGGEAFGDDLFVSRFYD